MAPREPFVGEVAEPIPRDLASDALALLSAVVAHPGSSLDALRLRARLAPAAFAVALRALSGANLITLRPRARAADPRAKAYPNPSGREVLAAAEVVAREAAGPPATSPAMGTPPGVEGGGRP